MSHKTTKSGLHVCPTKTTKSGLHVCPRRQTESRLTCVPQRQLHDFQQKKAHDTIIDLRGDVKEGRTPSVSQKFCVSEHHHFKCQISWNADSFGKVYRSNVLFSTVETCQVRPPWSQLNWRAGAWPSPSSL